MEPLDLRQIEAELFVQNAAQRDAIVDHVSFVLAARVASVSTRFATDTRAVVVIARIIRRRDER